MYFFKGDLETKLVEAARNVETNCHHIVTWPLSGSAKLMLGCRGGWLLKDGQWMV